METTKAATVCQLFVRVALSVSFLSAVADRLGGWGQPGAPAAVWGNWEKFVAYCQSVNSFASPQTNLVLALAATGLEILLPVCLLLGYKTRLAALATGVLLLCFAGAMTYSFGIKSSLDYSVWTASAASFLLGSFGGYSYTIDHLISKTQYGKAI